MRAASERRGGHGRSTSPRPRPTTCDLLIESATSRKAAAEAADLPGGTVAMPVPPQPPAKAAQARALAKEWGPTKERHAHAVTGRGRWHATRVYQKLGTFFCAPDPVHRRLLAAQRSSRGSRPPAAQPCSWPSSAPHGVCIEGAPRSPCCRRGSRRRGRASCIQHFWTRRAPPRGEPAQP